MRDDAMVGRCLIHINADNPTPAEQSMASGKMPFGEETGQS